MSEDGCLYSFRDMHFRVSHPSATFACRKVPSGEKFCKDTLIATSIQFDGEFFRFQLDEINCGLNVVKIDDAAPHDSID